MAVNGRLTDTRAAGEANAARHDDGEGAETTCTVAVMLAVVCSRDSQTSTRSQRRQGNGK